MKSKSWSSWPPDYSVGSTCITSSSSEPLTILISFAFPADPNMSNFERGLIPVKFDSLGFLKIFSFCSWLPNVPLRVCLARVVANFYNFSFYSRALFKGTNLFERNDWSTRKDGFWSDEAYDWLKPPNTPERILVSRDYLYAESSLLFVPKTISFASSVTGIPYSAEFSTMDYLRPLSSKTSLSWNEAIADGFPVI